MRPTGLLEVALNRLPLARGLAGRYVVDGSATDAAAAVALLTADGLTASVSLISAPARDEDDADAAVLRTLELLETLHAESLTRHAELSISLSVLGQSIPDVGTKVGLENVRRIARAARFAGTAITIDMEGHATTDATLEVLREIRKDFPETGIALQASLRRTEGDCYALAYEGSRVRLCKGGYDEPGAHAFTDRLEIDKSYVRCLKVLMAGQGYPMVATHDPRLIKIAGALATRHARAQGSYEYQLSLGVRTEEQKRLAAAGEQVRVYLPSGTDTTGYLLRRLAERPANLTFFVRSLLSQQ